MTTDILDRDTPFTSVDDGYHALSTNPLDLETNWWAINIPERRLGIWLHAAYYPNAGKVRWRVFAWDDKGADPARLAYYKIVDQAAMPPDPDLRDIIFPEGGYRLKMIAPLTDYYLEYQDPDRSFAIEVVFKGAHAPRRATPGEAPILHNPHLDQLGLYTGTLRLHGESIPIHCWSVRDRTWGPREGAHAQSQKYAGRPTRVLHPGGPRWREIERERGRGRVQYIFGHSDDQTGFLSFVRPQDGDAEGRSPLNTGWLLKDGRFGWIDKSRSWARVWRDRDTGWTRHMEVLVTDEEGRRLEAEGLAMSHMCEHGGGANTLMRWEYEGKVGWGEDQDRWRVDHFAHMLHALRSRR
ncbi:hypothetical protein [Sphingomonas sp. SRS2]|uniref:hypothetical protein n=1 Tax=Sphingomonas sp. SRS2 TaxID=133190 RepID=UPI0006184CA8|nr:hypothetical protein [Sphingomonas sp. SRS2]KKC25233.1 hypothetical protein WP12_15310 [Sphingomonas sp. SRS2]